MYRNIDMHIAEHFNTKTFRQ